MAEEFAVKGLVELQRFLDQLPEKLQRNVMRGALRAGMNVVKPAAQANIRSVSGELAKGLKIGTRSQGTTVIARLRATGPHAFVGHMLEFTGAAPHEILPAVAGSLVLGGFFYEAVQHPGFTPRPFMRPALDGEAQRAVVAAAEYIKTRLATKEGIEAAANVTIEGDE